MPSGMPASCVIRASWPPPTMPTTGNVTLQEYRPRHAGWFRHRYARFSVLVTGSFLTCEDMHGHRAGALVSMAGLTYSIA